MKKALLITTTIVMLFSLSCSKSLQKPPGEILPANNPDAVNNTNYMLNNKGIIYSDTIVNMIGYWKNVNHIATKSDGEILTFDPSPGEHYEFKEDNKAAFSSDMLGLYLHHAIYAQKDAKTITLQYKVYWTCSECGDPIDSAIRVSTLPVQFDKNGLWVVSVDNAFGGKTIWRYKRL